MQCAMTGESITLDISNTLTDVTANDNNKIIDATKEGEIRLCPLCQSEMRLFFINFNEKLLMCENTECEFPFGYEELQFVKEVSDVAPDDDSVSIRSKTSSHTASSIVSASAWSDIDKINRVCESEESPFETKESDTSKEIKRKKKENEETLLKHIEDIRGLTIELEELNSSSQKVGPSIKNEKWIKNLNNLQQMSGVKLLKPEEIGLMKKERPMLGLGELKIDIDPGNRDNMSSITIEIRNQGQEKPVNTAVSNVGSSESIQPTGKDPLPV